MARKSKIIVIIVYLLVFFFVHQTFAVGSLNHEA